MAAMAGPSAAAGRVVGRALVYASYGAPEAVLRLVETQVPTRLRAGEVLVEMLAAPINPSDINQIQGVYPVQPPLPAVGGNEGVGRVVAAGGNVNDLVAGDLVIPAGSGSGTWCTHKVCAATDLLRVPPTTSLELAATLTVNPSTAYRVLKDFATLRPGDAVIQNAANSGVGLAVIQIARHMRIPTINIIRRRAEPELEALKAQMNGLGASVIVTEDELDTAGVRDRVLDSLGRPRVVLGLNAVGGPATTAMLKWLDDRGVVVTYGAMAKKPVTAPASALIFRDIALRGFWMTRWNQVQARPTRLAMLQDLANLEQAGALRPAPLQRWALEDFAAAITAAQAPFRDRKPLLMLHQ